MPNSPFDSSAISRADALAALNEPENHPNLAKRLHDEMRAFGAKLQGGRLVRLMVKSDLEQVAAEALARAVSEAKYEDGQKPPRIEIVRLEKSGPRL